MLSQNLIVYPAPSDDPWMPAHRTDVVTNGWTADYAINLLGCMDQKQICSPDEAGNPIHCTNLTGFLPLLNDMLAGTVNSSFNTVQFFTFIRHLKYVQQTTMFSIVDGRGGAALNGMSCPTILPINNQNNR